MKTTLIAAFAATFTLFAAPAIAQEETPVTASEAPVAATTVTAKVDGMVCDFCAQAVKKVFGKQDSVASVDVDLDEGAIKLTLKPGHTLTDDEIAALVRKSGYTLTSIDRAAA